MRLVTAEEMRLADQAATNDFGIPGIVLMENAGQAVVREVETLLGSLAGKKAAIFCGGGNNGGDGLVVARHLHNRGCEVRLYFLSDPEIFRGDALANYTILNNMGLGGFQLSEGIRDQRMGFIDSVDAALTEQPEHVVYHVKSREGHRFP